VSIYAEGTSVPVERSRAEIETTLEKYGVTSFAFGREACQAMILFEAHDRRVRFILPLPDRSDFAQKFDKRRNCKVDRHPDDACKAWEQACRERWRSLCLALKAKLECVRCGISEFEQEFLAYVVLPNGQTLDEIVRPKIAQAYKENRMPSLIGIAGPNK